MARNQAQNAMDDGDGGDDGEAERLGAAAAAALSGGAAASQAQDQDDAEDYDLVMVDANGQPIGGAQSPQGRDDDGDHGEPSLASDVDDADGGEGTQGRMANRSRRQRWKNQRNREREELAVLRSRNAELEGRLQGVERTVGQIEPRLTAWDEQRQVEGLNGLNNQLAALDNELSNLENQMADALSRGPDGVADFLKSNKAQRELTVRRARVEYQRDQVQQAVQQRQQQGRQPARAGGQFADPQQQAQRQAAPQQGGVPPRVKSLVDKFVAENSDWYDPSGANEESSIAIAVCDQLAREGYSMERQETWDELYDRLQDRLPEVFEGRNSQGQRQMRSQPRREKGQAQPQRQAYPQQTRRGPMVGGAGEASRSAGSRTQVKITPAQREALVQANIMDVSGTIINPQKFKRVAAQYAELARSGGA